MKLVDKDIEDVQTSSNPHSVLNGILKCLIVDSTPLYPMGHRSHTTAPEEKLFITIYDKYLSNIIR